MQQLIAHAGGRSFPLRLDPQTDLKLALDYLTTPQAGRGTAPDSRLRYDWLESEDGFRVRKDAVDAYVIGHLEGAWAVAGEAH